MAGAVHGLRSPRLERVSLGFSMDILMTTTPLVSKAVTSACIPRAGGRAQRLAVWVWQLICVHWAGHSPPSVPREGGPSAVMANL